VGQWSISGDNGLLLGLSHRCIAGTFPGLGWDNGLLPGFGCNQPTGIFPGFFQDSDQPTSIKSKGKLEIAQICSGIGVMRIYTDILTIIYVLNLLFG
jgi:hypothetical protein